MMSELEKPQKICMKCGTGCGLLVLVCPACSEVLPDGTLPRYDFTLYERSPEKKLEITEFDSGNSHELIPQGTLPHTTQTSCEVTYEYIPQSIAPDTKVFEVIATLLGLATVVWLIVGWHQY